MSISDEVWEYVARKLGQSSAVKYKPNYRGDVGDVLSSNIVHDGLLDPYAEFRRELTTSPPQALQKAICRATIFPETRDDLL